MINVGYVPFDNYLITINVLLNYDNYVIRNNRMHLLKKDYALYITSNFEIIQIEDINNNNIYLEYINIKEVITSLYYYKNKNVAYDRLIYNTFFGHPYIHKYNHSGQIRIYYASGNLYKEFYHNNNKIEGLYKEYYENGKIKKELNYINNIIYD